MGVLQSLLKQKIAIRPIIDKIADKNIISITLFNYFCHKFSFT